MTYEILTKHSLDEAIEVLADAFTRSEPMTTARNITKHEFTDFVRVLWPMSGRDDLSLIGRDKDTGEVVAAVIATDFERTPDPEHLSHKFAPIIALLNALEEKYRAGRTIRAGKYLYIFMLTVSERRRGQNIGQQLLQTCLTNGTARGYVNAVTEAIGLVSQHVCIKLGFVERLRINYAEFVYHEKHPFRDIKHSTATILMDKQLTGGISCC